MKKVYSIYLMALFLVGCATPPVAPEGTHTQGQAPFHFSKNITKPIEAHYLVHLPESYPEDSKKKWPLILFLHGAGERGEDLDLVKRHGPPKLAEDDPSFPFIVVSPQCPEDKIWETDILIHLLDHVQTEYRIDLSRVYLTGLSMGGYGTWDLGLKHPERFAAIAPICGGGNWIDARLAGSQQRKALKNLGIWAFHGAKDEVVPLEQSKIMVEAAKAAGCKEAQLFVFPEAGHDAWTETYNSEELYDWFLAHER